MNLPKGDQGGVLADEVEAAFPELVVETINPNSTISEEDAKATFGDGNYKLNADGLVDLGEDVEFKSVNYLGLIPVMLQSIKELEQMVENQQNQIQALKKGLNFIKKD